MKNMYAFLKKAEAPGQPFRTQLWRLNDSPDPVPAGTARAVLKWSAETIELEAWNHPEAGAQTNVAGPELMTTLPTHWHGDSFRLEVEAGDLSHSYELKPGCPNTPLSFASFTGTPGVTLNQ
jgi:hypothetical protein